MRTRKRAPGACSRKVVGRGVPPAVAVLLAAVLLFACLPAALASPAWSDPYRVSTQSDDDNYEPQMALDRSGNAHVVWYGYGPGLHAAGIWYATNAGGTWSDPYWVSTQSEYEQYYPQIAVDGAGKAHVVWEGYDPDGNHEQIYYATNAGGTWSDPYRVSTQSEYGQYDPQIALDGSGKAHVVWYGYDAGENYYAIWYATNAGGAWSDPYWVSTQSEYDQYYPRIALDGSGKAHVAWYGYDPDDDYEQIYYATNAGGAWSDPYRVSTQSGYDQEDCRMALDSSGKAHLVWEGYDADEEDDLIWYATNAGGPWSGPVSISPDDYYPYFPEIAMDSAGKAHVIWHGHNDTYGAYCSILYSTNAAGTWSYPALLTDDHGHNGSWWPALALDPFDHPHVVSDGDDEDIWYTANLGSGWSTPQSLSTQSGYEQMAPRIAVDIDGNPHAVWFGWESEGSYQYVWYSADIRQRVVNARVEGGHGSVSPASQAVPIGGTATIAITPDEGYRVGSVTDNGAPVTPVPTGSYTISNVTQHHEVVVVFVPAIADWYLAEGSTDGGMETWVLVQNPNPDTVTVDLTLMTEKGPVNPPALQGVAIPPFSRISFNLGAQVTTFNVSTLVNSHGGDVVCERSMYGNGRAWGTASVGVTEPAAAWYLAEGSTNGEMETFVLVQNPNPGAVTVSLDFMTGKGGKAGPQDFSVPGDSRVTFKLNDFISDYNVSTLVTSHGGGVVCERSMYGGNRTWAHNSIGVTAPADTWYLAEGCTEGGMETFVLVQNPNPTAVTVSLDFMTAAGAKAGPQDFLVAGNSRHTFKVNDYVTDYNVSTKVTSKKGGVICERAMYGGGRAWGTDSVGVTAPADTWYLAEGCTDGGMETFLLVQNTNPTPVVVNLGFMTGAGAKAGSYPFMIAGNSRLTFRLNDFLTDYNVSTLVTSTGGPVICERSMYGNGRAWAHDSIGYAP